MGNWREKGRRVESNPIQSNPVTPLSLFLIEKIPKLSQEEELVVGNPLLQGGGGKFGAKRRWDDDVVFRNQVRQLRV